MIILVWPPVPPQIRNQVGRGRKCKGGPNNKCWVKPWCSDWKGSGPKTSLASASVASINDRKVSLPLGKNVKLSSPEWHPFKCLLRPTVIPQSIVETWWANTHLFYVSWIRICQLLTVMLTGEISMSQKKLSQTKVGESTQFLAFWPFPIPVANRQF